MNCKYCNKEYKSERFLLAHEEKCNQLIEAEENPIEKVIVTADDIVEYFEGHPRRKIKLEGLLSKTRDPQERLKISNILKTL